MSAKGAMYAKIKLQDAYVHLFNVHLQASYQSLKGKEMSTPVTIREEQLMMVRDFINQTLDQNRTANEDPGMVLLCGDFNVNANPEKNVIRTI